MKPIQGSVAFRPAARLVVETSHRPKIVDDTPNTRRTATDPVPMWLRELRRDRREFTV